jgi:hypothetical protein
MKVMTRLKIPRPTAATPRQRRCLVLRFQQRHHPLMPLLHLMVKIETRGEHREMAAVTDARRQMQPILEGRS